VIARVITSRFIKNALREVIKFPAKKLCQTILLCNGACFIVQFLMSNSRPSSVFLSIFRAFSKLLII